MADTIDYKFKEEHRVYRDGEPCNHKGCLNHITHPCEGCGRIGGRRVAGKISVDELKLFMGTGLILYDTHREHSVMLHGISFDFFAVDCDNVDWPIELHMGFTFKPIVRSLSKLTGEDMANMSHVFTDLLEAGYEGDISRFITLNDAMYLASKHYDFYGWLNKTGEDGQPLAVEKESV